MNNKTNKRKMNKEKITTEQMVEWITKSVPDEIEKGKDYIDNLSKNELINLSMKVAEEYEKQGNYFLSDAIMQRVLQATTIYPQLKTK